MTQHAIPIRRLQGTDEGVTPTLAPPKSLSLKQRRRMTDAVLILFMMCSLSDEGVSGPKEVRIHKQ